MSRQENTVKRIDHDSYANYLNQHFLGSEAGLRAFKAAVRTWKDTPQEKKLKSLVRQVNADRSDLKRILRDLGYKQKGFKRALTGVARLAGHLNPVNLFRLQRSSVGQLELDILTGMLRAKLAMWQTLEMVAEYDDRLDKKLLADLRHRAESQMKQVVAIIDETWDARFFEQP
ncbi:hypothetical protein [Jonesia quinghaiensis]|uniref:hypothetical protein n=1 Tax=Jonesia quinghaiensis TaxID=262806 RepID=UPI000423F46D|nr:hypothetical protein [Jonesia quinghaiensis]